MVAGRAVEVGAGARVVVPPATVLETGRVVVGLIGLVVVTVGAGGSVDDGRVVVGSVRSSL